MKGCRPLTDEEVEEIAWSFTGEYYNRNRAILGVKSGFHIFEILSLTIGDVVVKGNIVDTVHVRRCNMKKKTEGRTIPLNPAAKKALYEWIKQLIDFGFKSYDLICSGAVREKTSPYHVSRHGELLKMPVMLMSFRER
jgi:integrase